MSYFLEDGDVAQISAEGLLFTTAIKKKASREITKIDISDQAISKR